MRPNRTLCIAIIVLLFSAIQQQQNQLLAFVLLMERWINSCNRLLAASLRARNRRLRQLRRAPYAWSLPRPNESWFEIHYHDLTIPEEFFRQQLRMNRATFNTVLDVLGARIVRQNSRFRSCLSPAKVLAIGLYRLAHGNSYLTIGPTFNVGKSTVIEAVQDVVGALYELRDDHIKFPETLAEVNASIQSFEELSALPNIVGAIDGSHVRIKTPSDSAADYFSRYQQHDFIIQAVVNGKKVFTDFACGFPGSMHDARVLRGSAIFRSAEQGEILTAPTVIVGGREITPYLVGDSAYPLSPWLMKPYPEGTRDPQEITFNKELSSARVQVECAFGMLKNRWRILQKRFDSDIELAIKATIACAVLHNICIRNNDAWDEDDDNNDDDPEPGNISPNAIRDGDDVRNILRDFVSS